MTLQEALAKAQKFNTRLFRTGVAPNSLQAYLEQGGFQYDDVLANDWEVEEPTFTLTVEQLAQAWDKSIVGFKNVKNAENSPVFQALIRTLTEQGGAHE